MKKILFIFVFLGTLLSAQKVNIKKDKVIYDDKEIAIVKSPYRDHYEFYSLSNKKIFEADLKGVDLAQEQFMHYLDMKSADGKTTQIPYEVLVTSLKVERIIAHLLTMKYNLFSPSGIDEKKVEEFFGQTRENLADKYNQMKANSLADAGGRNARISSIKARINPRMGSSGEILYNNGNYPAKIAGNVKRYQCDGFSTNPCLEIFDLDNIKVASMYPNKSIRTYVVKTYDGNQFILDAGRSYASSDYAFITEFVAHLIAEGYTLEHQAKAKMAELENAKINDAVARSINLYDVPGHVTEKSGKKSEGLLTIWFEKLDINRTGERLPTEGADTYGQNVVLRTTLPGNNKITKKFNADSGASFCVNVGGTQECYYGLSVKGDLMKKLQNFGDMHGNSAYFYRLVAKEKGIMLLQDPVELQKYVIKTDVQDRGQMIDNRSNEKLSEKLAEYLMDCKKIADQIKSESIDLKTEENLIYIIKEYSSNCKK